MDLSITRTDCFEAIVIMVAIGLAIMIFKR